MSGESQENLRTSLTSLSINEASTSTSTMEEHELSRTIPSPVPDQNITIGELNPEEVRKRQLFRDLPVQNVSEKIIICVDTCVDPGNPIPFKTGDESSYSTLFMLKRITDFFVHNKNFIHSKHEFALVALDKKNIKWLNGFTSVPREITRALNDLNFTCEQEEEYDLGVLLEEIWKQVSIPTKQNDLSITPPYVVRLILLYSRSHSVPVLKKPFKELLENPYFIIDVIATFDESVDKNKMLEIFTKLQIDEKGYSYNYLVGRDAKLIHESMGKLLAHSLQRPPQSEMTYSTPVFDAEE